MPGKRKSGGLKQLAVIWVLSSLTAGCTIVGPEAIRSGRLAYNQAITETNNQQILMVLVQNRYEETSHLLSVASVTANVRISGSAAFEAGIGDSDNYRGNLVPFQGGFVYEENPTISYMPVNSEQYLRQLVAPVPVDLFHTLVQSLPEPAYAYDMLLAAINDIRNSAFLYEDQQDDPRFERVVALMTELTWEHSLHWTQDSGSPGSFNIEITPATERQAEKTAELLRLLNRPGDPVAGERTLITIYVAGQESELHGIRVQTRSIMQLVQMLSAAVAVPEQHLSENQAVTFPRPGRATRNLKISYSESPPDAAYVAVEHGEGWFYIDGRDINTKRYFKLLGNLLSAAMAKSLGQSQSAPVLTVPVSR